MACHASHHSLEQTKAEDCSTALSSGYLLLKKNAECGSSDSALGVGPSPPILHIKH